MENFGRSNDIGEIIIESLFSSNIDSITDLKLSGNESWFKNSSTNQEICNNADLVSEIISKQAGIHHINLSSNKFSSNAT